MGMIKDVAFAGRALSEWSDEELVAMAKNGDKEATARLLTRYHYFVRLKSNSYFLAGGDGDDLIQEGYIGLYKAIRDYEYGRSTSFRSFAELNTYVSFSHSPSSADFDTRTLADVIPSGRASDPVQQVISSEECISLTDCLIRLMSPLEARVLKYYMEGNSYEDIAAEIGHDTKTVDNALQRIKRKVTLHLESRRVLL
jgi:RNA polymerase sporulation-specific sigma factor